MKTSAELQQQSFIRKLIYFGLILLLFTVMTFAGTLARSLGLGRAAEWGVTAQADRMQLREAKKGQASVLGSTARLSLTGSRGFAVCLLWMTAIEKQKRHEWNDLEMLVNVITKLQPHFLTPWLFQSWNLSYNVSVESDRVRDKYFYIAKGIELLAEGERVNRAYGRDAAGNEFVVGHPDMRYWVGFYYQNKFGISDEQNALRSLLQLSCINPVERNPRNFRTENGRVKPDDPKFREFVERHPALCRRLRDFLRCSQPDDVVDFLEDNAQLPTRYEQVDATTWQLKRKAEDQFPVLPDSALTVHKVDPHKELTDEFGNFHATWAWGTFAQEPMPPVEYGKPAYTPPPYDPLRYRLNRQPAAIVFRQAPHRALSYIAERLQKEGWFDNQGWEVDEFLTSDRWFPGDRVVVGVGDRYSSQQAWKEAHEAWDEHGRRHGLSLDQTQRDNLEQTARPFRAEYGLEQGQPALHITEDQVPSHLREGLDAHRQLTFLAQNITVTNFPHFLYEAEAESNPNMVAARKLLYSAEALRRHGKYEPAIARFQEGFERLCGTPGAGRIGLLEQYPNFRFDTTQIETLYEKHVTYLRLLDEYRGVTVRRAFSAAELVALGTRGTAADLGGLVAAGVYQASARPRELPSLFSAPLDGRDSQERRWVPEDIAVRVKVQQGLMTPPNMGPMQGNIPTMPGVAAPVGNQ